MEQLAAKIAALPVLDARTPEKILGCDDFGIPGLRREPVLATGNDFTATDLDVYRS